MYFELDAIGALVMLFSRRDGGLRVSVVGEPDLANECPAVLYCYTEFAGETLPSLQC
jgi:hypothetical protein